MAVVNPSYGDIELNLEVGVATIDQAASSFLSVEMSREHGAPVSLYLFTWGAAVSNYYAYTDAEEPITHDGKVYEPIVIGRSKIRASGGLDQKTLKVETTLDSEIAQLYFAGGPSFRTTLTVYQGHFGHPDFVAVFAGRLVSVDPRGPLVEIGVEPASTAMRTVGLRRHYQYGCPLVLFGRQCRADFDAVKQVATVSAFTKAGVTLAAGWNGPIAIEKFRNGYIVWIGAAGQTEVRTIVDATTTGLLLSRKLVDVIIGTSLDIYPGCNHQWSDCSGLHVEVGTGKPNGINYGGQRFIPTQNPIGRASQYY